jgi:lipoprotein-releasing system ATP-binding protein
MSSAIELLHVCKELMLGNGKNKRALTIISDISLRIEEGEFVAITGPSGSGKSSLLYLMGGLDKPTAGKVLIEGIDVAAMSEEKLTNLRTSTVGFVYQFHFLLPEFTSLENVMMPQYAAAGVPMHTAKKRAAELLDLVGLGDRMDHRPNQLSGGQQQRVAIARSLANKPKIVFADEPTGNLDSAAASSIFKLFAELNSLHSQTIVVVTHEQHLAERAQRIIHLVDGRIESDLAAGQGN